MTLIIKCPIILSYLFLLIATENIIIAIKEFGLITKGYQCLSETLTSVEKQHCC